MGENGLNAGLINMKYYKSMLNGFAQFSVLWCFSLVLSKHVPGWQIWSKWFEFWLGSDKNLHILVGLVLPLSLARLLSLRSKPVLLQFTFFLTMLGCFLIDEYSQLWLAHREFSTVDLLASALGWGCASLLWFARSLMSVAGLSLKWD